ncbi:MAG: ATP-binding cassette domain-containing protein [Clostridiaceae bacterium]
MSEPIIQVEHLTKTFGQDTVLKWVTREFERGKIHGIVGNNGSGKTVLFKCICGFLQPTEGHVLVNGKQIGRDIDFPEDIGIIIESPGFLPQFSGLKNLEILAGLKRKISLKQVADAIRRVGLNPLAAKHVGKYSLGMRQRLGIAQAIMEEPSLMILDEPLNGLDKYGVAEMRSLFQSLAEDGRTILLASHNIQDIETLCDTVCEMDAGVLTVIRETPLKEGVNA